MDRVHGWLGVGYANPMCHHEQFMPDQRVEEPLHVRDDRRKQAVKPDHSPVPANPPVERDEVERGREKLERVLN